jgi:ABC-type multidrug transport system fused ATPase/permease subunit
VNQRSSILAVLNEFLTRYPKQFGLLFILLVIEGLTAAVSVLAIVPLADYILDTSLSKPSQITRIVIDGMHLLGIHPAFWTFGILFVALNFLKGLMEVAIRYAILRIKYAVLEGLLGDALITFFKSRWEFFSGSDQGRILNSLNREINTIGDTLGHLATLLAQIVQLFIYLAVPLMLNAQLTLTSFGLAILLGSPLLLLHRLSYRFGQQNTETANRAQGILSEILGAARLILGFGRQNNSRIRFLEAFSEHARATLRSQVLSSAVPKFFQPIGMLSIVIALGIALQEQVVIPEITAIMWSLLAAMPILSSLLQGNISISNFLPSYEQLISLRKRAATLEEIMGDRTFSRIEQGIELRELCFTYPNRIQTLVDVNLHIRRGQMTALVGESGSGKSTVTDLILGLQIPEKGHILIDGVPLGEWQQNSFRERIGYVPQDPQLFHSSIRDNLLWAFEGALESELWAALQLANAEAFVKDLPQGIDTIVGDRGIRLSGGQRQRIALARALIRKPELLILDEATSALDSESEKLIQQSIERISEDTTILVVAHRLSTISRADQVYVLQQGCVIEEGRFSELSKKTGGILNAMLLEQSQIFKERLPDREE